MPPRLASTGRWLMRQPCGFDEKALTSARVPYTSGVTDQVAEPPKRTALSFLIRNALTLVSTSFLTSGLGFLYWAAAARLYDATVVGESATAIAAMNLLSPVAMLGLGTLLVSELPKRTERRGETVVAAAGISGAAGAVLALVAALLLPSAFLGLPGIGSEWGATALFVVGVATQVVGLVFDSALLSTWGGGLQLGRNAVFSDRQARRRHRARRHPELHHLAERVRELGDRQRRLVRHHRAVDVAHAGSRGRDSCPAGACSPAAGARPPPTTPSTWR